MARKIQPSRRRAGRTDSGAAWISYSDMMAALLLVFVLVLCYSIYQYFSMLETKTAELDRQSALLTLQQTQLESKESDLLAKQEQLDGALQAVQEQKGILESQNLTLEEQARLILNAQAALKQKEADLAAAQQELTAAQQELTAAQQELSGAQRTLTAAQQELKTQQQVMDTQQKRLDDLVGVRTRIIQELSNELSQAKLKASVDRNTGDIMLQSAVFFDVGKDEIKEGGRAFLDEFIPVYLSVLLRPEYAQDLGEIIIEGHTDTQGTYLKNLELSQKRALSVATYCLGMNGLTSAQRERLRDILTAKGRSYSVPIYLPNSTKVDMDASRRVEFKFRLKDAEMIDEIRKILAQ
ncbi:MAG: OmpA family protein [Clostridiales bacterium]|nr:OmpA family protein [Clostridiales bacterium]